GAGATFNGSGSVTITTNGSGIASSPVPTANSIVGTYSVTASVTGLTPANFTLTNTTAPTGLTIFPTTAPPATFYQSAPIELGVKLRSDVNGTVTAIRYYKSSSDTSTHTGSLWSATGALLATGTFTNETASGWQQLNLSTP